MTNKQASILYINLKIIYFKMGATSGASELKIQFVQAFTLLFS